MVLVATNDVEVEIDTANKDTEVEGGPPSSKATAGKKTVQMGRVGAIALPALASLIILAYFHGVFWVVFRWAWPDEYDPKLAAPRREQIRVLAVAYLLFVTIVLATFVGFKRPEDLVAAWSGTRGCSLAGKKRAARLAGPGFLGAIAVNFMMMACIMAFVDTRRATGGQVEFPFKRGNCSRALSGASNADVPMPDFAATGSVCQAYTKGDPFIKSRAPINKCLALHGVPEKERMVTLHQMLSLLTAMLPVWERGYGEGEEKSSARWANFGLFKAKCAAQYELAACSAVFPTGVKVLRADGTRHATGWSFTYFVVSGALIWQPLRVVFPFRLIGAGGRGFEENDQEDLEGVQRSESRQRPRRMATRKKSSALQRKASESWRSFKRQHPCVQRLVRLWAWAQQDVFDPGGRLYVIKMALLESATTTLQIVGIVNEAPTTNGFDIVVWSWLITFNISALSLVGMLFQFPKRFEPNYVMAILIGTNVLSDQSYMFYTLFLKEASLSSSSSFGEELIFHAQTLVPAAMVALVATDIIHLRVRASEINEAAAVYKIQNLFKELLLSRKLRDAAATSSQRQTAAATIIQIRYRNRKAWRYVAPITSNSKQHCVKRRLSRRSIIRMRLLVAAVGLLFGTYTTISYQIRANGCYKVLGRAAFCATPQYYFAN
eukprot:g4280.t1